MTTGEFFFNDIDYISFRSVSSEDTLARAAITINSDAFKASFPSLHINIIDVVFSCFVRKIESGTNRSINIILPDSLHINSILPENIMSSYKIFRKVFFILNSIFFHILFNNRSIYFIINGFSRTIKRFSFTSVRVRENRLDAARYANHSREGSSRSNGKKRAVAETMFFNHFKFCAIKVKRLDIITVRDKFINAFRKRTFFNSKSIGYHYCLLGHSLSDVFTEVKSIRATIGETHFNKAVGKTHNSKSAVSPILCDITLNFKRVEVNAFIKNFIKSANCNLNRITKIFSIKLSILIYESCKVNTAEEATAAIRERLFAARVSSSNFISGVITIHIPIKNTVPEKSARLSHHPVIVSHIFKKCLRVKFFMNEFFSCFTDET